MKKTAKISEYLLRNFTWDLESNYRG